MQIELTPQVESRIRELATTLCLPVESVLELVIERGLNLIDAGEDPRVLLGMFSEPSDSAVLDDALELAMAERVRRNQVS